MESEQLVGAWKAAGERLVTFPSAVFDGLPIPLETKTFLCNVGLPVSAAPFLDFGPPRAGALPTVGQLWRLGDGHLADFFVIGSNGSGDSIAVGPTGKVFYLNHDDGFRPCYINRDVRTMSEILLQYRQLAEDAVKRNGPDAFLEGHVPNESLEALVDLLQDRDPDALSEGSMWAEELGALHGSTAS